MNETELERLVVRLIGDVSGFVDEMKKAQKATEDAANKMTEQAQKVETGFTAAAGALAALGAKEFLSGALGDFTQADRIGRQLTATLEANGRAVEETKAEYVEFANQLQATTTQEDDATLALLKQAETFDLTGAAARRAVKDAIAIGEINESNAASMIRLTAAVAKGDIQTAMMFSRMVPQLRGVRNEQEFMDRFNRLTAAGWSVVGQEAETAAGKMQQLENDFGNLKESIGETVAEGVIPLAQAGRDLTAWFARQHESVQQAITVAGMLAAAWVTLAATGTTVTGIVSALVVQMKALAVAALASPWAVLAAAAAVFAVTLNRVNRELDEAVKKSKELDDLMAKRAGRGMEEQLERVRRARLSGDSAGMDAELKQATAEVERLKKLQQDARQRIKELGGDPLTLETSVGNALSKLGRQIAADPEMEQAEDQLRTTEKQLAALRDQLERIREIINRPGRNEGLGLMGGMLGIGAMMPKIAEDMKREAEELRKSVLTPQEKLVEETNRYQQMLRTGAISQETYDRGVKKLAEDLNQAADAQARLNQNVDAAAYGSSEAARRIAAQFPHARPHVERVPDRERPAGIDLAGEARGRGNEGFEGIRPGWHRGRTAVSVPGGGSWNFPGEEKVAGKLDKIIEVLTAMGIAGIRLGHVRVRG